MLAALRTQLSTSTSVPTRLIIPTLLSPLLYPPHSSDPTHLISFLHTLRSLLRLHSHLTILLSWPLALYPRSNILTRLAESLSDGVVTLHPFPHAYSVDSIEPTSSTTSGSAKRGDEEKMQGLVKVWKLPVLSERGVSVGSGEDMAFAVGRKRFLVRPFHLPPLEGEEQDDKAGGAKELQF
jgi:elongator complex protein 4